MPHSQIIWKDLELFRKTTKAYKLQFNRDGLPINITGWTIYFTMKANMADTDENAIIKKDVVNHVQPLNGTTLIGLNSSDTDVDARAYYYDIKYKDIDGNLDIIVRGKIRVSEPVTQRE